MCNKKASFIYFSLFILNITYYIILFIRNPGIYSFNLFWAALAVFFFINAYKLTKKDSSAKYKIPKPYIIVLAISLLYFIPSLIVILTPKINEGTKQTEYVIVLGGGIKRDGTITPGPFNRLQKASDYLIKNPDSMVIVTGGTSPFNKHAEADTMKKTLINMGVKPERILVEDKARDTIQNLTYSAQMIAERENISLQEALDKDIIIITSHFHLNRAELLAKRLGYTNITGLASAIEYIDIPTSYIRESLAYIKLGLRILLTHKPSPIS